MNGNQKRQLFAHYFKASVRSLGRHTVIISESSRPVGKEIEVTGKREARKVALELDAMPWNF